jgi:hypothetical protein
MVGEDKSSWRRDEMDFHCEHEVTDLIASDLINIERKLIGKA